MNFIAVSLTVGKEITWFHRRTIP